VADRRSDTDTLGRREYLRATGAAAVGVAGLAGCVGRATGTLATGVTDQPADIGDFESLVVTIEGIWLGPEGATNDTEETGVNATDDETATDDEPADREYHELDEPRQADLVRLQGEETQLIDERELSTATYQYLQLDISAVDGTLADGDDAAVDRPGDAPLTFNEPFEIRENTRTSFTADFAPVRRGTGRYLLRPVPRGIEVAYESTDGADGAT